MEAAMKLLVVGNDRICRAYLQQNPLPQGVTVAVDKSTDAFRVLKLLRSGSLSIGLVVRMFLADRERPDAPPIVGTSISSSAQLRQMVRRLNPDSIILFRAGLIIRKDLI